VDVVDNGHADYLLGAGMVTNADVKAPAPPHAVDTHTPVSDPDDSVPRPPHVAAKALWVDYAVMHGLDRAEAELMTKESDSSRKNLNAIKKTHNFALNN
jgi:hypothetical protein